MAILTPFSLSFLHRDLAPSVDPYGTVDEHGNQVQHLPPLSEALHTDDMNNPANAADHLNVHGGAYGSHATAHAYDPQQQGDPSHGVGAGQGGQYDHQSSNFFDTQHMEPPPSADGTSHHATQHTATINASGHANGYGAAIMTPPPPASSHGYPSSPYQSAGASAPLFHRASISGPVMHHHYAAPTGAQTAAGHNTDVWSSTPAAARPHTADGMFASQMGGLPGQWASISDYNRGPRGSIGSMSDAAPTSGGGKVFSYMPSNGDDSSSTAGSQSHHTSGGPRKRPRRRYDEIERLYTCSWPGCQKSYGTLNHLNAHVAMQKHGPKRSPGEFKEMRKAWRKGKREEEQRRQASAAAANEDALSRSKMMFAAPNQPFMTHGGYGMNNFGGQSAHQMPPPAPAPSSGSHFPGHNGRGAYGYNPAGMDTSRSYGGGQGGAASSGGLGAYLMAHRGSI